MGNRAIITSHPFDASNVGVYVHWNGGLRGIYAEIDAFHNDEHYNDTLDDLGDAEHERRRLED